MSKLRVAIVGCGSVARHAHCPAWVANPDVELVGLCDSDFENIRRIEHLTGHVAPTFDSMPGMLKSVTPDVVDICTPGYLHYEQTKYALEAGANVLVEKPPVMSAEHADELCRLIEAHGRKVGVMLNYRYRDLVMRLKQAVDSGALGKVVRVRITHHGALVFTDAKWLWDEKRSKYLLWEFGIHFIDILVYLLGSPVEITHVIPTVNEAVGHTTDVEIRIIFDGGAIGSLEIVADTTRHSSSLTEIQVYGTAQDAFVRWFPPSIRFESGTINPLRLIRDEIVAAGTIATRLLTGQFKRHRNISHYRAIDSFTGWLLGAQDHSMSLQNVLPTLYLVAQLADRIGTYSAVQQTD